MRAVKQESWLVVCVERCSQFSKGLRVSTRGFPFEPASSNGHSSLVNIVHKVVWNKDISSKFDGAASNPYDSAPLNQTVRANSRYFYTNDPSAGSPTETLLRLLLPLSDNVYTTLYCNARGPTIAQVWIIYRITRSVGATGGVYKGQGRNQHEMMTHTY